MLEIKQILCPVDFSDTSQRALDHAIALARQYGAALTVLNVIPTALPPPSIVLAGVVDPVAPTTVDRPPAHEAQLQAWLAPARDAGVAARAAIDEGSAARRILEHVGSSHADLLVMGTHGLSGFDRLLIGSVTEKVLRKATCPVLTVPPMATAKLPYQRLLCPVDFSDSSVTALDVACSLATEAGAKVTVLHVFDWPEQEPPELARFESEQMRRYIEEDAGRRLAALVNDMGTKCSASTLVTRAKPYRGILEVAERAAVDLIVIGVRGRHPVDVTLFGSTTNQVIRGAGCPVLTVRR